MASFDWVRGVLAALAFAVALAVVSILLVFSAACWWLVLRLVA
jgi:hypothetical protein